MHHVDSVKNKITGMFFLLLLICCSSSSSSSSAFSLHTEKPSVLELCPVLVASHSSSSQLHLRCSHLWRQVHMRALISQLQVNANARGCRSKSAWRSAYLSGQHADEGNKFPAAYFVLGDQPCLWCGPRHV